MTVFIRHIRKHRFLICACALILAFQSFFALSLPYLMGELIGVGIQQKGIDTRCPEKLTEKAMSIFSFILPEKEYKEYISLHQKKDGMYILKGEDFSERAGEIYENAVMSGFYVALKEADGKITNLDTATVNSVMNIATVSYLYNSLEHIEKLSEAQKESSYTMAEQAPEALRSQLAGFTLPYFYEDAGMSLEDSQNSYIYRVGTLMIFFCVMQIVCLLLAGRLSARISANVEADIRQEFLLHTANFTRKQRRLLKSDLYSVFTSDINNIGSITEFMLSAVLYAPFVTVGGIILSFMLSPSLSAVVFLTVAAAMGVVFAIYRITLPRYDNLQRSYGFLVRFAKSSISQLYTVRTMQTQNLERSRFLAVADNVRKNERYVLKAIFTALSLVSLLSNVITAVCVVLSGNSLLSSRLGTGDVIAFLQYSVLTVSAVTTLASTVLFAPRAKGSFESLDEVMSIRTDERGADEGLQLKKEGNSVEFRDISLDCGLKNVSFTAEKGSITALVGPTGCGKTTLLSLLTADSQKESGEVLIDGIPIEEISLASLRRQISFAHSEPVIFSGSLKDNMLLFGAESEEAMDKALYGAAVDFIESKDTPLKNKGNNFSGGQKSRIALAGAFSKKAGVYIIDDCLRTVDAKTEEHILSYIRQLSRSSAVILVTQRINSLIKADKIVVFSKEGIEAQGTHSELMEKSALYRELASLQGMEVSGCE